MRSLIKLATAFWMAIAWLSPAAAQNTWGSTANEAPKGFSWTDPVAPGFWMAWTNATIAFFVFIFACIALMAVLEWRRPGGHPRDGVFGLSTTRGRPVPLLPAS